MTIITLLTDFGTVDGYVGEMKGVLHTRAPGATVVDIAHDLPPQDVEAGRLTLARYWQRFPPGTVHVAVVDPGVGSARAALAIASAGRFLVGPDNGLLSPALLMPDARCFTLPTPPGASATFHGRDIFAPAAASLAHGAAIETLGEPFTGPVVLRTPEATKSANGDIHGIVMGVDRFGNVLTNLVTRKPGVVSVGARTLRVVRTYADVAPGELTAVVGSSGFIEIAVRDGHACALLNVKRGAAVVLRADS